MLIDAQELENGTTIQADICIVGSGAAGITLARELDGTGHAVAILESGGMSPDIETQSLYSGRFEGPYRGDEYLVSTRLRYFGGTTNHWAGTCRPLDPIDFEERPWVAHSGWPITKKDLDPYYTRSAPVVEIKRFAIGGKDGAVFPENPFRRQSRGHFVPKILFRSPPTRFGRKYRDLLAASKNVKVYHHANAVHLQVDSDAKRLMHLDASTLSGKTLKFQAKYYALAAGGIENPRLMLNSDDVVPGGIGNQTGNLGKYFMDHAHMAGSGIVVWSDQRARFRTLAAATRIFRFLKNGFYSVFTPPYSVQWKEKLLNGGVRLYPTPAVPAGTDKDVLALSQIVDRADLDFEVRTLELTDSCKFYMEHTPHPQSRVALTPDRDALGLRRVRVTWHATQQVEDAIFDTCESFARELGYLGLGRAQIVLDRDMPFTGEGGLSSHHMGTTRMHKDPKQGVVTPNCRVNGIANLFIAGSSVFPTGGFANPTFTIVALAIRLADHLKKLV